MFASFSRQDSYALLSSFAVVRRFPTLRLSGPHARSKISFPSFTGESTARVLLSRTKSAAGCDVKTDGYAARAGRGRPLPALASDAVYSVDPAIEKMIADV